LGGIAIGGGLNQGVTNAAAKFRHYQHQRQPRLRQRRRVQGHRPAQGRRRGSAGGRGPVADTAREFRHARRLGQFPGRRQRRGAECHRGFCRGCFTKGDRLALDASVGAGWSDYKTYSADNIVGGRAGVQWTW